MHPDIFFLFLHESIWCGYSLDVPQRGASNEYPQHIFLWGVKNNIHTFPMKKVPYLDCCLVKPGNERKLHISLFTCRALDKALST